MSSTKIFVHQQGRYFSKFFLLLGLLAIVVPVILSFFEINWPLVFVPLGALAFIPSQQFEVDGTNKKCRDCTNILGFKLGKWQDLNGVKYITIIRHNYAFLRSSGLMAMDSKEEVEYAYGLNFYFSSKKRIEIDEFETKKESIILGKQIASLLKLPLVDTTTAPPSTIA